MAVTDDPRALDEIHRRYATERDKRVRSDGNDQYVEVRGAFGRYTADPWTEPAPRDPVFDEVTAVFIGGGFGGLVTGARLTEAGIDVRIIEKGGDFGGTWYWNRYPGAQCDTHSFVYLPLLEETGHMPSEKYAHGPEILEHSRRIAHHFGLYEKALLSTEVTDVRWDDEAARWQIRTNRGDEFRARFVLMSTGPLHRPKLPGVPGLDSFEGHSFHTSRWDYGYTGGDPDGAPLTGLADKRVGIIGTGATSVQCIPHLARSCPELYVFQRTPSSIDVRNNAPTDPDWFAREVLAPGWQDTWIRNFTANQTGQYAETDLVMDGWTDLTLRIRRRLMSSPDPDLSPEGLLNAYLESDDDKMAEIRDRCDELVHDPATAAALKPWYRQLCKRPCFHDEYLQAFNEPGTTLVDTDGRGVERIDGTGVWAGGRHYDLDCIIYATGFEVGTPQGRRAGFDPKGRDGVSLDVHWAHGMRSLHGMFVHGFPNLFVVGASQGAALISNYPHNLTEAGRTAATVIRHVLDHDVTAFECTAEAEAAWLEVLASNPRLSIIGSTDCTPGYYNNEGHGYDNTGGVGLGQGYPGGALAFFDHVAGWLASGDFTGLDLR
ncbi:MAG: flavin-containing monooxygenase [Acidimicrobiales bacterium]